MAKPKTQAGESAGAKRKPAAQPADAATPLVKIAQLDHELVRLVQERATLVIEAAGQSALPGQPPFASALDEEVLKRLTAASHGPLPHRCVRAVLREIQSGCRSLIHEPRITFRAALQLQPPGVIHRFGQRCSSCPGSIAAVFEEVHRKQSDFGIVPVENSRTAAYDTLEMFTRMRVRSAAKWN